MTKEMTEGSPLRLIFNFSLPLILGSLLQQTYSLIDAAIVGKYLGINDLAAVGASTSVVFLIIGFCTGCCCGFGIPVAQAFGARSYSDLRRYVANSLWVSLIISVNIIHALPGAVTLAWTTLVYKDGAVVPMGAMLLVALIAFLIVVVALVVTVPPAPRRLPVQYAKRVMGN